MRPVWLVTREAGASASRTLLGYGLHEYPRTPPVRSRPVSLASTQPAYGLLSVTTLAFVASTGFPAAVLTPLTV
jgi:hypothetical protein